LVKANIVPIKNIKIYAVKTESKMCVFQLELAILSSFGVIS